MRHFLGYLVIGILCSCSRTKAPKPFSTVAIETLYTDSLSIRAIEIVGNSLAFAANKGVFGTVDLTTGSVRTNVEKYHTIIPEFRAIGHTPTDFFMLSVGSPALLYKTGDKGKMDLVYMEEGDGVFYDAMAFWNALEGMAIGDSVDGCLSIIITRDGGTTWHKLPCETLPSAMEGEGAFAASNTNIAMVGDKTWIGTTSGRIYFSPDKGETWEVRLTSIVHKKPTQGIYSIAFYDANVGIAIGGDYTDPDNNKANKAITKNGGKDWSLLADGQNPQYKSCVQFVPNSDGKGIVALGFTGISYSPDQGSTWKQLSDRSFYTFRFLNDTIAYAAGKSNIAKLVFH